MSLSHNVRQSQRRSQQGFGLIEVLIALVIIGIIAGIAVPSYQNSVLKSRRADARASLMSVAQRLERCRTQFGTYTDAGCAVSASLDSESGHYRINVTRTAAQFTLTANPVGGQTKDKTCTELSVNHLGQRMAEGADSDECW